MCFHHRRERLRYLQHIRTSIVFEFHQSVYHASLDIRPVFFICQFWSLATDCTYSVFNTLSLTYWTYRYFNFIHAPCENPCKSVSHPNLLVKSWILLFVRLETKEKERVFWCANPNVCLSLLVSTAFVLLGATATRSSSSLLPFYLTSHHLSTLPNFLSNFVSFLPSFFVTLPLLLLFYLDLLFWEELLTRQTTSLCNRIHCHPFGDSSQAARSYPYLDQYHVRFFVLSCVSLLFLALQPIHFWSRISLDQRHSQRGLP